MHIHWKHNKDKDPGLYEDLMIPDCILDICITSTNAKPYISCSVESVLVVQEKEKKERILSAVIINEHSQITL
eukprot:3354865-Ditylum_brightwellii.AAC.1